MSFLRQLVDEITQARTDPKSYADKVEAYIPHFKDLILRLPNTNVGIKTQEGADAYKECVNYLRNTKIECEAQIPSKGLTKIADELLVVVQKDPSQIGSVNMNELIDKYGSFTGAFNRVMECGGTTPEQVVVNILVSDGDKNRSQRDALLNKSLKRIGVASGKHDIYKNATIIIFSTTFTNNFDSDDNETYGGPSYESSQPKVEPEQPKPEPIKEPEQPKPEPKREPEPNSLPMLKEKIVEQPKPVIKQPPSDTGVNDENVVSVDRAERVVIEKGKKKKKITLTKHYKDGHTEKEVKFENL